jgi:FkbM family methyltransferase
MKFNYRHKTFDIEGVSQKDHIYNTIVKTRCFYEIDLLEYMYFIRNHFPKENALAIDVGANIGNHSIFFRYFLADHLIAVEPNSELVPILEKNLNRNVDNYSIYDCALGATDGLGTLFYPDGATNNSGMAKIDPDGPNNTTRITTLDSIVENWIENHDGEGAVSIIKIDVEGMEMAVLKGARNTLLKNRPNLFIEAATPEEFRELDTYLGKLGYKAISRWAVTPVYHFSCNPSYLLLFATRFTKLFNLARRIKVKLTGTCRA